MWWFSRRADHGLSFDNYGSILLLRRGSGKHKGNWEPPGGTKEFWDYVPFFLSCVRREFKEETNLEVTNTRPLVYGFTAKNTSGDDVKHFFSFVETQAGPVHRKRQLISVSL